MYAWRFATPVYTATCVKQICRYWISNDLWYISMENTRVHKMKAMKYIDWPPQSSSNARPKKRCLNDSLSTSIWRKLSIYIGAPVMTEEMILVTWAPLNHSIEKIHYKFIASYDHRMFSKHRSFCIVKHSKHRHRTKDKAEKQEWFLLTNSRNEFHESIVRPFEPFHKLAGACSPISKYSVSKPNYNALVAYGQ